MPRPGILMVDDDDDIRLLVQLTLERGSYDVALAADAAEAQVHLAGATAIDLLITDLYMPKVGGIELAALALQARPTLKVLFISGLADRLPAELQSASVNWLLKPFTASELLEAVQRMIPQAGDEVLRIPG